MTGTGPKRGGVVRRLAVAGIASFAAFCVLVGLGTWQLQRLAEKDRLIAEIDARMKAPPSALPSQAEWPKLAPDAYEYRHVRLEGTFDGARQALVFRPDGVGAARSLGAGYLVMTPLRLASGAYVIVDRGYVPSDYRDQVSPPPASTVTVTGLMRQPEPRNIFTPADEPARGQWFTRDPAAMARQLGLTDVAPFSIDADAGRRSGGWPVGGQTVTAIPNNHLAYAFTWFGLAATLMGVFGAWAYAQMKGGR